MSERPRRVVVEHSPTLFELVGLDTDGSAGDVLSFVHSDETFYRARSTPRWVLFRHAVKGHGETLPLHRNQR